jgi:LEA14-like dessication related protein
MISSRSLRLAVVAALLAAACGGPRVRAPTPALAPPVLRVDALVPVGMDAEGVTLRLVGRIENPNPVALSVDYFDYALELEGRSVEGGRFESGLALPALGAVEVLVPARLRWTAVPDLLTLLAEEGAVPVRVHGRAYVRGAGALAYAVAGQVVLPKLPRVALAGSTVRESGLLRTTVDLRLEIENPNDFPLPSGALAYDLTLSGVSVSRAQTHDLGAVGPRGRTTVVVPVRFSTVGAAAGLASTALGGRGDLALTGRARFGGLAVGIDARTPLVR